MKTDEVAGESGAIEWQKGPPGTDGVHQQESGAPAEPGTQGGLGHEPGSRKDDASENSGEIGPECSVLALVPEFVLDRGFRSNGWQTA